jgi:uncharacterized YigZ family protein
MKNTIASEVSIELTIDKSRFVGILSPIHSKQEFQARVAQARMNHPKANHVIHAAIWDSSMSLDDDGEPAKTAASPMFDVLNHHQLTNVVCIAVRYFGGVKLGAGGLVRAYTKTAAQCIDAATILVPVSNPCYQLSMNYETFHKLPSMMPFQTHHIEYLELVHCRISFAESEEKTFLSLTHLFEEMNKQDNFIEYVVK